MIDEDQLELGAAEVRQTFGRGERQIAELGMLVVDDLGRNLRGSFRRLAGGGGVAGERPQDADLHGLGCSRRRRREQGGSHEHHGGHHR